MSELKFEYGILPNHCTEACYCFLPPNPVPIGFIWYRRLQRESLVDVLYVWVHERKRRKRVASKMLAELWGINPGSTLYTEVANRQSEPWLRYLGFVKTQNGWFLRPGNWRK